MTISSTIFNDVPAEMRLPGWYVEFDNRLAGYSVFQGKLLVIGQMVSTGTAAFGQAVRVTNEQRGDELFGRGSMLAEMLRAIKQVDLYTDTWALPVEDLEGATAATGDIAVLDIPTDTSPLALYIGGYRVWVNLEAGNTHIKVAQAIEASINADDRLPVTAKIRANNKRIVDLTCKWTGATGNDVDLRESALGEPSPRGLSLRYSARLTGGVGNPDLSQAIAGMGSEWWNWIVCPYNDLANLRKLHKELADRFGPMRQIGGRAFTAYRGAHSWTATVGHRMNSPHITMMGTGFAVSPPWLWAATNAIVAAKSLAIDPARPLQTLPLPGLIGPAESERWTDAERNLLLYDGISTYTIDTDGTVRIERQITQYRENAAGIPDDSYLDINTPETLERIRFEEISLFAQKYPRHKLAEDVDRPYYDPSQPIMTPKLAKAELLDLYRMKFMGAYGWVRDYEGYAKSLQANIDPNNPNRLNIVDSPKLIGQYRVHAQQTQFRR